jgi:hypothetical protein
MIGPEIFAALEKRMQEIAEAASARPAFVHQRTVEQHIGLPHRDYLRLARAGAFPSTKERRLVLARYEDVVAYVELRLRASAAPPANDGDAEAIAFAKVGARRVGR